MRVGYKHCTHRWIDTGGRRRGVRRAQRKWRRRNELVGLIWKEAGDCSKGSLSKIVKHTEACAENGTPIRILIELICQTQSGRHIPVGCLIERGAARRQGHGRRIIQAYYCEWIVG